MKHLMTLIALVVAVTAGAQGTTIHEYPWNPDWNNDNFVGSSDLTGFLSAFGSEFGNPPEPCDYDGTELEEWAIAVSNGSITIDSVYIEFQLEDVISYYVPGCPDQVTDTVYFSNQGMCLTSPQGVTSSEFPILIFGTNGLDSFGSSLGISLSYNQANNEFKWYLACNSISNLYGAEGVFSGSWFATTNGSQLPWPENWNYDANGLELDWTFGWASYANYIHILPYWH